MDYFALLFFVVFALVVGRLLYGYVRHGSFTGAFLGGSIVRTEGEVRLSSSGLSSQVVKIHAMRPADGNEPFVALVLTSKAPLAASMQPIKLTRRQAEELAELLQKASR
jgi:hypothetical protein